MAKTRHYDSDDVTVFFEPRRCIHAAECVHGLPQVFDPDKRPWIDPKKAGADQIAEVVHRCPTGALTYERHDDGGSEETLETTQGRLAENGPVYLRGRILLKSAEGETLVECTRLALCRCGASKNKPFCDGRHTEISFEASAALPAAGGELPQLDPAPLEGTVAANGPVVCRGPLEILDADGQVVFRREKAALCRCGASGNKPFCDGSHVSAGFEAP